MYIVDAIKQAKALRPFEYTVKECIAWCDELSSDIRRNYDERYSSKTVSGAVSVLLPPGIDIMDVSKVIMDGRELDKTDLRDFGITYEYEARGRRLKKNDGVPSDFEIIYRQQHEPIRYIDGVYTIIAYDGYFEIEDIGIYAGDTLKITVNDEYTVHITDIDDGKYYYTGDTLPAGVNPVHIYREIQDETLLPPPYDTAYVDFIIAKSCLYQGDQEGYASFAAQCNEKLTDYKKYADVNKPREKRKFTNWI